MHASGRRQPTREHRPRSSFVAAAEAMEVAAARLERLEIALGSLQVPSARLRSGTE